MLFLLSNKCQGTIEGNTIHVKFLIDHVPIEDRVKINNAVVNAIKSLDYTGISVDLLAMDLLKFTEGALKYVKADFPMAKKSMIRKMFIDILLPVWVKKIMVESPVKKSKPKFYSWGG